jgi:predicted amidophosphoribosyltransferase
VQRKMRGQFRRDAIPYFAFSPHPCSSTRWQFPSLRSATRCLHQLLFSFFTWRLNMLTAHSLCWLCQMPLALAAGGSAPLHARAAACLSTVWPAGRRRMPCGRCLQKPPPWQRLVAVNDYRSPLSGLIHS